LEIDARFPSQTPTVVYQSSGINLVQELWQSGKEFDCTNLAANPARGAIYEHIRVAGQSLSVCGEHIMAEVGPLSLHRNFFGAQEALTNYRPGQSCWVATLIILGEDLQAAQVLREEVLDTIRQKLGITEYLDPVPSSIAEQRRPCLIAEGAD
jgi:pyrrolysine biosynthesis protein PylC